MGRVYQSTSEDLLEMSTIIKQRTLLPFRKILLKARSIIFAFARLIDLSKLFSIPPGIPLPLITQAMFFRRVIKIPRRILTGIIALIRHLRPLFQHLPKRGIPKKNWQY